MRPHKSPLVLAPAGEASPVPCWIEQSQWALRYGLFMLSVGVAGLTAGILRFPPNVVSITATNSAKEPLEFNLQVTGVAVLSGFLILVCFMEAFRSFLRARELQDRITRWLLILEEDLSPEERLRLIEQGPRKVSEPNAESRVLKRRPVQLHLAWPARTEQASRDETDTK